MKRAVLFLICILTVISVCSCSTKTVDPNNGANLRDVIIAENASINSTDETAGAQWILKYADKLGVEATEDDCVFVDKLRTSELSSSFDVCFSQWQVASKVNMVVCEYVYPDGNRHLADIYRLTDINGNLKYAMNLLKADSRIGSSIKDSISVKNECIGDIKEYNISETIPYSARYTLLGKVSVNDKMICYGQSTGEKWMLRVKASVDPVRGIINPKSTNEDVNDISNGVTLINRSYHICYSDESGHLVIQNRLLEEKVLCEVDKTEGETYRMPVLFDVYDERVAIYTVYGQDYVRGYGIIDAATGTTYTTEDGSVPISMSGDRLYLLITQPDGSKALGYRDLTDFASDGTVLDKISEQLDIGAVDTELGVNDDGTKLAVLQTDSSGISHVGVYDVESAELLSESTILSRFANPKYVGFLDGGEVMVLSEGKLLCDDYLYVINIGEAK